MKALSHLLALACVIGISNLNAQISIVVNQGEEWDLPATYATDDLIQGLIPTVLPGDSGWHPVNTDPVDQLAAFTDGQGTIGPFTGLLADYPGDGWPAKLIRYTLPVPADIDEIRVFTGNDGRDGRVFHTYTVRFSSDNAQTFTDYIYVQSHASGTLNNQAWNQWRVVLSQLTDAAGPLARGVTDIEFNFYAVDNTQGQMRDPFSGVNPFTGTDDGLSFPVVSPLIWEIDVLGTAAVSPPRLTAGLAGDQLELTWAAHEGNPVIEAATQLETPDWADLNPQPDIEVGESTRTARVPRDGAARYFRLRIEK